MKTIYKNGRVYTGDGFADCFVTEGDRFLWVGQAEALPETEGETVDLGGRFVCAGFIDSHMHLINYGYTLTVADLAHHTESLQGMLDYLRQYVQDTHPAAGAWVKGRGFNHDYFTNANRFPTRYDLDEVSTEHPICITRACGHICVVNSKALELLHITRDTPQPEGGRIAMDENGEPLGQFFENALSLVYGSFPLPTEEELCSMIRAACSRLNRYGITSSHTDDYCSFTGLDYKTVMAAYQKLERRGELTVRVHEQAQFDSYEAFCRFTQDGAHLVHSDYFGNGPLKMLGDGSLGARTAFLSRPYADAPDTCGIAVYTQAELDKMVTHAHRHGMSAAIHAIGDGILDRILNAYEKALQSSPRADHRFGIVHCQITRPDQLEKIRKLGIHVYTQSIFLDYDTHIVRQRVGDTLADTSYCAASILRQGGTLSNGSDSPVEEPVVLRGIQCAVTRKSIGSTDAPYRPQEALTVTQAIDTFTKGGAYAAFEEACKGRIAPGMLADFVVLAEDPTTADPETLHRIAVLQTVLGGKTVYRA